MIIRAPALRFLSQFFALPRRAPRWAEHEKFARKAYIIVQCFFILFLYVIVDLIIYIQGLAATPSDFEPLWPVQWIEFVGFEPAAKGLIAFSILSGIAAITSWHKFTVRLAVCFAIFQGVAIWNSRGAINHPYHEIFWISVCFLFLPNANYNKIMVSRVAKMQLLSVISGAMILILLFYTMSGIYKCLDALAMLLAGEKGGFSPYAMADTLAWTRIEGNTAPIFSDMIINHPILGWPMFLFLYYVELTAIVIFFRPALHGVWGYGLILFHFGTIVFMGIPFNLHIVINALLFVMSPYAPEKIEPRAAAASLPIFGVIFRRAFGWHANGAPRHSSALDRSKPDRTAVGM